MWALLALCGWETSTYHFAGACVCVFVLMISGLYGTGRGGLGTWQIKGQQGQTQTSRCWRKRDEWGGTENGDREEEQRGEESKRIHSGGKSGRRGVQRWMNRERCCLQTEEG